MNDGQVACDTHVTLRTCTRCGDEKPDFEFHRDNKVKSGRISRCKSCMSTYAKKYWQDNKGRTERRYRVSRYGITHSDYVEMLEKQGHVCAICGTNPHPDRSLCVDHDHESGQVRSLLCIRCNLGIGYFLEDPDLMHKAIRYVESHKR